MWWKVTEYERKAILELFGQEVDIYHISKKDFKKLYNRAVEWHQGDIERLGQLETISKFIDLRTTKENLSEERNILDQIRKDLLELSSIKLENDDKFGKANHRKVFVKMKGINSEIKYKGNLILSKKFNAENNYFDNGFYVNEEELINTMSTWNDKFHGKVVSKDGEILNLEEIQKLVKSSMQKAKISEFVKKDGTVSNNKYMRSIHLFDQTTKNFHPNGFINYGKEYGPDVFPNGIYVNAEEIVKKINENTEDEKKSTPLLENRHPKILSIEDKQKKVLGLEDKRIKPLELEDKSVKPLELEDKKGEPLKLEDKRKKPLEIEKKKDQKDKEKDPPKKKESRSPKKGLITILNELTKGLEIKKKTGKRYTASNISVSKQFKAELQSGNYLYNITSVAQSIVKGISSAIRKVAAKIMLSKEQKENMNTLMMRLDDLMKNHEQDFLTIYNEYRGSRVIQERFPTAINVAINKKVEEYTLGKLHKLNEQNKKAIKKSLILMNS